MIYEVPPVGFNPVGVAVCIIEHGNQILLLQRSAEELHPGVWSLPSGKIEKDETPEQTVRREIIEECGFSVDDPTYMTTVYLRHNAYDYVNYIFKQIVMVRPNIKLDLRENSQYAWLTRAQVDVLDKEEKLIFDEFACIKLVYNNSEFGTVLG